MLVVCCHFNPCGYTLPLENYWKFREALGCDLQTIELSFNGLYEIPDALHVRGTSDNLMWQKERLLNILIERSDEDKVAWVDADILWDNPNWYAEAEELLDEFAAVQLFESIDFLGADGKVEITKESAMSHYAKTGEVSINYFPGGAWAARRDAIPGGLMDENVIGGGDVWMALGWLGIWNGWATNKMNEVWRKVFLTRAASYFRAAGRKLSCVSGKGTHLYHGSRKNRQYGERLAYLTDFDFDPMTDIALDTNGLWKWSSDKPEMHQKVADYFDERNEDG